ncbi:beta-ketoacyl synthase N-terminal-like domain-containing protein [Streptomyces alboniger]|uniref:3-oxoacyl-ACP synthase n=1 Tax=Streptomyces alboniger TaxID=132473 RepID=A0A5J6HIG3_STRAD|nr:beta-ketoacyl synthase N-terminal-like domain-containing protein [Streptomyces alboniger]QEV19966.1 3-oxoacyl-ACP synthase [Streptomyces alboniger]
MSAVATGVGLAVPGARTATQLTTHTAEGADPFDPAALIGKKGLRYLDQATRLALCAARDALNAAGLMTGDARLTTPPGGGAPAVAAELLVPGESVAVVVSSNFGNLDSVCEVATAIAADGGTRLLSPVYAPRLSSNVTASEIAIRFGLRGPNLMLCNGPTSGLDAVHWATVLLAAGRARHVLVVGAEPANDVVRRLTGHAHPLDGAAALVLESPAAAAGRGAPVLAGLHGYVRTGSLADCLFALGGAPHAWLAPRQAPVDALPGVPRHDLEDRWGPASGALGVLQCAAAVGHFAAGGGGPVYAVAGTDSDDAVAGLVLTAPGGAVTGSGVARA